MKASVSTEFVAAGCARGSGMMDWSPSGLLAYAAQQDVCLARETGVDYRVLKTFCPHKGSKIVCVRFAKGFQPGKPSFLMTAAESGEIGQWKVSDAEGGNPAVLCVTLLKSSTVVTYCHAYLHESAIYQFWTQPQALCMSAYTPAQGAGRVSKFTTSDSFASVLDVTRYEESFIVAVGMSRGAVDIFSSKVPELALSRLTTVKHRHHSVRSVSFSADQIRSQCYLAVAADISIHVWKFSFADTDKDDEANEALEFKPTILAVDPESPDTSKCSLVLDSVLQEHTASVFSVSWGADGRHLLSAGQDRSAIIWEPNASEGLWVSILRFGSSAGRETEFYDAMFSADATEVVYHMYSGGFSRWRISLKEDASTATPAPILIGGPASSANDVAWSPCGSYFLTSSDDMTTRIYARTANGAYGEVARPQVHGYSVFTVASITSSRFVSAGEEPILRVFEAPGTFVDSFLDQTGMNRDQVFPGDLHLAYSAQQPELGLSNKAVLADAATASEEQTTAAEVTKGLPTEDVLAQNTLWPEIQKLYGHPYIVQAVAVNHRGSLIATSCRASSPEDAVILLFRIGDWECIGRLPGHRLTVTDLQFSHDDRYLLSVSRDRTWCLHCASGSDDAYEQLTNSETCGSSFKHTRIIFASAWHPREDIFVTVGRDKYLALWQVVEDGTSRQVKTLGTFQANEPITAVDLHSGYSIDCLLIYGTETGVIGLLSSSVNGAGGALFEELVRLDRNEAFSSSVTRIRFRNSTTATNENGEAPSSLEVAVTSQSGLAKLFTIKLSSGQC